MLMFDPRKGRSFLRELFETLAVWALVVKGCEFAWKYWSISTPEVLWAYTVATGFATIYLSMFVCFARQAIYLARIDEKAAYCAELERKLLRKRLSSRYGSREDT